MLLRIILINSVDERRRGIFGTFYPTVENGRSAGGDDGDPGRDLPHRRAMHLADGRQSPVGVTQIVNARDVARHTAPPRQEQPVMPRTQRGHDLAQRTIGDNELAVRPSRYRR